MSNNTHNGIFLVKANRTVEEYANNKGGGGGGSTIVQIPIPAVQTYTYNGTEQTFAFVSAIDSSLVTLSGNKQTNAGEYTVTATLVNASDVWSDLTNAPKSFAWTIAKAQGSFSLSANSASVDVNNPTATINVSNVVGDGVISVASSDDNVATASISNGVITITGVGTGTATITVTMADGTNYLGDSHTISVTAVFEVQITFTIESAGNDTITVLDSNNNPVFPSGLEPNTNSSGIGTVTMEIPGNGGSYKFISSVAKNIIGDTTQYYSDVFALSQATTLVKLIPNDVPVWYGWCDTYEYTGRWYHGTNPFTTYKPMAPIVTQTASALSVTSPILSETSDTIAYSELKFTRGIDVTGKTKLKVRVKNSAKTPGTANHHALVSLNSFTNANDFAQDTVYDYLVYLDNSTADTFSGEAQRNINRSGTLYFTINIGTQGSNDTYYKITLNDIEAIWVE